LTGIGHRIGCLYRELEQFHAGVTGGGAGKTKDKGLDCISMELYIIVNIFFKA